MGYQRKATKHNPVPYRCNVMRKDNYVNIFLCWSCKTILDSQPNNSGPYVMQPFPYLLKIEQNVYTKWNKVTLLELRVKIENKKKSYF